MRILILFIFFTFSLHTCKDYKTEKKVKTIIVKEKLPLTFFPVMEIRRDFILQGKVYTYEYKFDQNTIRVATKKSNEGFHNEIYAEGSLVGKLKNNSWTAKPYYFKNKNFGLLFIEEGDEEGIWGYNIFFVKGKKIEQIGFVDVSSVENSSLDRFLTLTQENNLVLFNFLESNVFFYGKVINRSEQLINIDIKTLKIIKSKK
ncbi:hypothetical protein [Chryseobacterium vrystaatense]|uniref:Uncharacterized protein n=1 Tax=Chryseobacterium vrystaatense TaxID=307480 RepID=A0A1M4W751_9FLAO|nr:hypothetical protein [Chryseobacterium vrystaatense]SHE77104.1 hypothetical protein SAMN02787073_1089 [Chryseobacterium vrystaatense]